MKKAANLRLLNLSLLYPVQSTHFPGVFSISSSIASSVKIISARYVRMKQGVCPTWLIFLILSSPKVYLNAPLPLEILWHFIILLYMNNVLCVMIHPSFISLKKWKILLEEAIG